MDKPNYTLSYTFHRRGPFYFPNSYRNISILCKRGSNITVYATNLALLDVNYNGELARNLISQKMDSMISIEWFGRNPFYRQESFVLLIITTMVCPCGKWCILHLALWFTP